MRAKNPQDRYQSAEAVLGDLEKLREGLELEARWTRHHPSVDLARVHFAPGEPDRGFGRLAEACETREPGLRAVKIDPLFDGVRSDPRCAAIVRNVGPA